MARSRLKAPLNLRVENAPIETIKKMVTMRLGVGFVPLMCVREERARGELAVLALAEVRPFARPLSHLNERDRKLLLHIIANRA